MLNKNPKTVVLVDDSRTIVEIVKVYLTGFGFEYCTATDASSGLELVKKHNPVLLISDINMPVMTGFELAEKIRADRKLNGVGILLLSTDKSHALRALLAADGFLGKPIDGEKLAEEVGRILKKRAASR